MIGCAGVAGGSLVQGVHSQAVPPAEQVREGMSRLASPRRSISSSLPWPVLLPIHSAGATLPVSTILLNSNNGYNGGNV